MQPRWLEIIVEGYEKDPLAQKLLSELALSSPNDQGYALDKGVIRYQGKIWLGSHSEAHDAVLKALHSSAIGGHSGMEATYQRVAALFIWPGMKSYIQKYVQSCVVCQQAKGEHVKYPGKLQPLPVPPEAWHTINMDFIEKLPSLMGLTRSL